MNNPNKENKWLNVFLIDSKKMPRPTGYTQSFFNDLFFSVSKELTNPEGGKIEGSVYDYFYNESDGYIRAQGKVNNWTTIDEDLTTIPHYRSGTPAPAFEAIIAVGVAACLKKNGVKTLNDLKVGNNSIDGIAFLMVDYKGGGAKRWLNGSHDHSVKTQLTLLGRTDLWDPAWDSWNIEFLFVPVTEVPGIQMNSDGTTNQVITASDLKWFPSHVLLHECGHLMLDLPDLYGTQYGSWGQMDLMGNSISEVNPAKLSSYSQTRSGWFNTEKFPFRTHKSLLLHPLETHSRAYEYPMGIGINPETVVVENRHRWNYWGGADPTSNLGNALYIYRKDENKTPRQIVPNGDKEPIRRITTPIKRPGNWGEVWGAGVNHLVEMGSALGNSLNYLGENWWNFTNIDVLADDSIEYDAELKAVDLLASYTSAVWTNGNGKTLTPNKFMGEDGHVMLVNRSLPIENKERFNHVLSLHPNWKKNGKVKGKWQIDTPNTKSGRLYIEVALSEEASGSDGVNFNVLKHTRSSAKIVLSSQLTLSRNHRIIAVDFNEIETSTLSISMEVKAGNTSTRDWVYVLNAFFVPTSTIQYDFIKMAPSAKWKGSKGDINYISPPRAPKDGGEVSIKNYSRLQNGTIYGGGNLFTHPSWENQGFIRGTYRVQLPNSNSVFRAELGFLEDRKVTSNGVTVKISFRRMKTTTVLMDKASLKRETANGEVGLENNPITAITIPIPTNLRGQNGEFIIEVNADGSSGQDWVLWTMMKLTSD